MFGFPFSELHALWGFLSQATKKDKSVTHITQPQVSALLPSDEAMGAPRGQLIF